MDSSRKLEDCPRSSTIYDTNMNLKISARYEILSRYKGYASHHAHLAWESSLGKSNSRIHQFFCLSDKSASAEIRQR